MSSLKKEAAVCLRMIWQGHDERDKSICSDGAFGLYSILTDKGADLKIRAADLVQEAFWLADEAEQHQDKDGNLESIFYKRAGECLTQSRQLVGLEIESVPHTIAWWKAYRHKDNKTLVENLIQEHAIQIKTPELAEKLTYMLLDAAAEHKKKYWKAVDKKLEEYFEIYLPNLI